MPSEKTVKVRLTGDISQFNQAMLAATAGTKGFANEIDQSNHQMGLLVSSALALGPALVPIGASLTPVITGLTSQLGFAALGAGVAVAAFNGVGDSLKALNEYQLDPTADNFDKMREAMSGIGPEGQDFVRFLQDIRPQMQELQEISRAGLLPGVQEGIDQFMSMMPQVERVVGNIALAMGDLSTQAGQALSGPKWEAFFNYLESDARPILTEFGQTLGNLTLGLSNLFVAFAPASASFSASFLEMSRSFAEWTANLPETEGFQGFLDYLADIGPQVWETLGAIGGALMSLLEAAAPIGSVLLPMLTGMSRAFSTIMDSDIGPMLVGVTAAVNGLALAMKLGGLANFGVMGKSLATMTVAMRAQIGLLPVATRLHFDYGAALDYSTSATARAASTHAAFAKGFGGLGKAAGAVGILAFAFSDLDEKMGLSNTAMFATMGLMVGPWGAAVGAGAGLMMDLADANVTVTESLATFNQELDRGTIPLEQQKSMLEAYRVAIDAMSQGAPGYLKDEVQEAIGPLTEAEGKVRDNIRAAQDLRFEEAGLGTAMDGASDSFRDQAYEFLKNTTNAQRNADQKIGSLNGEIAYERAVDAATETIKRNGAATDITTKAGRENVSGLNAQITEWNNLTPAAQAARGGIDVARAAIIKSAEAAGHGKEKVEELSGQLVDLKSPEEIKIEVEAQQAKEALAAIRTGLANINPFKRVNVEIRQSYTTNGQRVTGGYGGGITRAGGGPVYGPGTTTSDSIPALLSNKEYVIKASSVDKYGVGFMHAVNAGRFAAGGLAGASRLPAQYQFADGGMAGSRVGAVAAGDGIDYDRLAQSMAGLGIAVEVGIGQRTAAKIVATGTKTYKGQR